MSSDNGRLTFSRETLRDLQVDDVTARSVRGGGESVWDNNQMCEMLVSELDRRGLGTTEPIDELLRHIREVPMPEVDLKERQDLDLDPDDLRVSREPDLGDAGDRLRRIRGEGSDQG